MQNLTSSPLSHPPSLNPEATAMLPHIVHQVLTTGLYKYCWHRMIFVYSPPLVSLLSRSREPDHTCSKLFSVVTMQFFIYVNQPLPYTSENPKELLSTLERVTNNTKIVAGNYFSQRNLILVWRSGFLQRNSEFTEISKS